VEDEERWMVSGKSDRSKDLHGNVHIDLDVLFSVVSQPQ
jgi:hypothetical protein